MRGTSVTLSLLLPLCLGVAVLAAGPAGAADLSFLWSEASSTSPIGTTTAAAGSCDGIGDGIWNGCRGTGCHVCQEKLGGYDCYFLNHPDCVLNTTCAGQFFSCDSACPPPNDADRCLRPNCPDYSYSQWACWNAGCNYSPGYCAGFQDQHGNYCWNYWNDWDCNFAFGSCWWVQGFCYS